MTASASRNGRATSKPKPLSDLEAARLVLRVATSRELPADDVMRRLPSEWREAVLLAEEDGEAGIAAWLKVERTRLRSDLPRFDALAKALGDARAEGPSVDVEPAATPRQGPPPFRLNPLGAIDLSRASYRLSWHVERILVADQPGVVGAPKKSLKTTTMIDLAVSLASGRDFLGQFRVPAPVPVYLLSGESGGFVLQETVRRVCRSKEVILESLEGFLFVEDKLPQLGVQEHLDELARVIRELAIKVVIVDPLYLCLLCGIPGKRLDASNLFDMGPLLLAIARTCLELGATPLLVHHFRKTGTEPYELPELEDLAFAGIQEFARQWILLKRRQRYEPGTGEHRLWLSVGGSAGHSGEWALDVHEGTMDLEFQGREWRVEVKAASEARGDTEEQKQAARVEREAERRRQDEDRKAQETQADAAKVLEVLRKLGKSTKRHLSEVAKVSGARVAAAVLQLVEQGQIRAVGIKVRSGKGERGSPL